MDLTLHPPSHLTDALPGSAQAGEGTVKKRLHQSICICIVVAGVSEWRACSLYLGWEG